MRTQSVDTHPKVEQIQIDLIRQTSVAQRISKMRSLTSSLMRLSKRAIRRANPGLSKEELDVLFVKYHYSEDLAVRLRKYLHQRNPYGNV